jgi:hypothetical protein
LKDGRHLGTLAQRAALLLLSNSLAACASGGGGGLGFAEDRGGNPAYPANYRSELLAFLRTYLNNPAGVRQANLTEPLQRTVGGRLRYIVCLRYDAVEADGGHRGARERAVIYVEGRLDQLVENGGEICAGATYTAFPELEKLTR